MKTIIKVTQVATQENILLLDRINSRMSTQEGDEIVFPFNFEVDKLNKLQLLKYSDEEFEDIISFVTSGDVLINEIELESMQETLRTFIYDYMLRFNRLIITAQQTRN